jgi:hypothetical protein
MYVTVKTSPTQSSGEALQLRPISEVGAYTGHEQNDSEYFALFSPCFI